MQNLVYYISLSIILICSLNIKTEKQTFREIFNGKPSVIILYN